MLILFLTLIIISLSLVFFLRDCCLRRGRRAAFNFFFFSFFYCLFWIWRDISQDLFSLTLADRAAVLPAPFSTTLLALISIITILGWMALFYLGWLCAEKILSFFKGYNKLLFPTLILSSLAISIILFPVGEFINGITWQRWFVPVIPNGIFLIGHPRRLWLEGFYFCLPFLAAYFLIEFSAWKDKSWKMVFFILPFVYLWTIRLFGAEIGVFYGRAIILSAIIILAVFNKSKIDSLKRGK